MKDGKREQRTSMKARFNSTCPKCGNQIRKGQTIRRAGKKWVCPPCYATETGITEKIFGKPEAGEVTAPDLIMIDVNGPEADVTELSKAWAIIGVLYEDCECENPDSGEIWQYMGTSRDEGMAFYHTFRHRDLPGHGRIYQRVDATVTWQPARKAA